MFIEKLKSKLSYLSVTDNQLYYEGSITLDKKLIEQAGLIKGEKVEVLNLNTGARFQTYVIEGQEDSGEVCLNGPAARLGYKGDKIIVLSYGLLSKEESSVLKAVYVVVDENNKIKKRYEK